MLLTHSKQMRPHQKQMLTWACSRKRIALYAEMRVGKCLPTVHWALAHRARCVLIVGPYSVQRSWRDTLAALGIYNFTVLCGTHAERVEMLKGIVAAYHRVDKPQTAFFFINKEAARSLSELFDYGNLFDCIVADESRFLANPKKHTAAGRKHLSQAWFWNVFANVNNIRLRAVLSGTPATESDLEYIQQMHFLDPRIIGEDYYRFRARHCFHVQETGEWTVTKRAKRLLAERMAKHCYFITRKEAGIYDEKTYVTRTIKMQSAVQRVYSKAEKSLILENEHGELLKKTLFNVAAWHWLRQLTGGVLPECSRTWCGKLPLLEELLCVHGELYGARVIVWAALSAEIDAINACLQAHKIRSVIADGRNVKMRQANVAAFIAKRFDVLVCQPECMRHGEDFSDVDAEIYYSSPAGLETRLQSEDRVINMNKKSASLIIDLVVEDSVDEDILLSYKRKGGRSAQIAEIVKRIRNRVVTALR